MKIPQKINDPVLGTLIYEPEHLLYNGKINIGDITIDLHISIRNTTDIMELIKHVRMQLRNMGDLTAQALIYAVSVLVPIKNRDWREDGEKIVSEATLEQSLKLRAITAYSKNGIDIWFADSGTFLGHDIRIRANSEGEFLSVDLSG